jgi:amino acid adenylation domain-containing protein
MLSEEDKELLEYLRRQEAQKQASRYRIARCAAREHYPLSSGQQRLWFLDQIEPGNPAYHFCFRLSFKGSFDRNALAAALNEVVRRHDVLRAQYVVRELDLVQTIVSFVPVELPFVDLSQRAAHEREGARDAAVQRLNEEPFDLARGPLFRGLIVRESAQSHLLAMCFHHIVTDRWSMDVFVGELNRLYAAYAAGASSPLPDLPIQYTDYAVWEREAQRNGAYEPGLRYWYAQLADPPALELPLDRPRPATRGYGSARVIQTLPSAVGEALQARVRSEGVTAFMAYLTAFAAMLHRVSGQSDIVLGTPVANRVLPELEALIGYFTNTLVLRMDLAGDPSLGEALARVRSVLLDAYRHQEVPLETLVERLAPKRDLSRTPLFQVLFVHLQGRPAAGRAAGASGSGPELSQPDKVSTDYDLEVYVTDQAAEVIVAFHYRTDIFDQATVSRMADYFALILAVLAVDPGRAIGAIPLLGGEQRARMIASGCGPAQALPQACVHRMIEEVARRSPTAVAVEAGDEQLDYATLNARANRLARELRTHGIAPGSLVGICIDRSVDLVVAVLGAMKSGAAYVPLDAAFPRERLAFMIEDAGLGVIVTRGGLAHEVLPAFSAKTVDVETSRQEPPDGADAADLDDAPGPHDLAYVIFTSGSTGRPKGVCIEHRALASFARYAGEVLGIGPRDRLLGVASLSFDASVLDLFVPLVCGARLILASREAAADGASLADLVQSSEATLMHATPATWQLLRRSGWKGRTGLRALSGGEALPWPLAEWLSRTCAQVLNLYGPTEATVYVAIGEVRGSGQGVVGIGAPLPNTSIHVLDGALQPVPAGFVGELCIGGVQVARGYLGREELTRRQFVADPLSDAAGARLYRTGDLARRRNDGGIEFLGRADHQVKLRGHRIELGEIESMLMEDPGVAQAVVLCREDIPEDKRLVAYVAGNGPNALDPKTLRTALAARLPAYMVPSAVVVLDALPLTPNRKVDRAALPAPREVAGTGPVRGEPESAMERLLADVWADALGGVGVGVHDNFFDLGGHSLLVITVLERMRERTGVALTPREYMMQNLRQIAALYERPPVSATRGPQRRQRGQQPAAAGRR